MSNANERLARLEAKAEQLRKDIVVTTEHIGYSHMGGGRFGMHPNFHYLKGIEASTGSLGHGLSLSVGYALSARMDKRDFWVVCMTGDGEMDEGSNWEALMTGAQYGLGNLVLIVDKNQFQIGGTTTEIKSLEPLDKRLEFFGWDVINIENGNDMAQVLAALDKLPKPDSQTRRRPIAIISNTLKGIGPFLALRALDQVHTDVAYQNIPRPHRQHPFRPDLRRRPDAL